MKEKTKTIKSQNNGNLKQSKENTNTLTKEKNKLSEQKTKDSKSGPTKLQMNRLKNFYNTTRWLPNSAFTTYFGKPAFENYGYGNTNPVYGGLFYGNYMLSHNMNPMDGSNHPEEKQVYSSALLKSLKRGGIRKPSPPRKIPEEIRNTPEELEEIKTRKQIFQLPNNFPSRDIIPPNLLKSRYFRNDKYMTEELEEENEDEYEDWNIENVLNGKKNKKIKINKDTDKFNPYSQGKVELKKKKMKVGLDNKLSGEIYPKKKLHKNSIKEEIEKSEGEKMYEQQKNYFLKMLGEENIKNLEDFSKLEVEKEEVPKDKINDNKINIEQNEKEIKENIKPETIPINPLKKKENPALLPPDIELVKQNNNNFVCCINHSQLPFNLEEKDPRNYQGMPPCMLSSIIPAGKPSHVLAPLNIFANEYTD
jgi:hypothetical protein